jgi:hypothetical protein
MAQSTHIALMDFSGSRKVKRGALLCVNTLVSEGGGKVVYTLLGCTVM